MEIRKPLLNKNYRIVIWILIFTYLWVPKDNFSLPLKYIIGILAILLSLVLLLDIYNPEIQNRSQFIWKLRVFFWGDPNIKMK